MFEYSLRHHGREFVLLPKICGLSKKYRIWIQSIRSIRNKIIKKKIICINNYKLSYLLHKKISYNQIIAQRVQTYFWERFWQKTVSRDKIYIYLDIKLDYTTQGQIKITIIKFLKTILETWIKTESDGGNTKNSVAMDDFFKINKNTKKLDTKKLVTFHNIVTKILFSTKHARPNCGISILFFFHKWENPISITGAN